MDFRTLLWDWAQADGWRVYYLGGKPGIVDAARDALNARWPGPVIGGRDGFFEWGGAAGGWRCSPRSQPFAPTY